MICHWVQITPISVTISKNYLNFQLAIIQSFALKILCKKKKHSWMGNFSTFKMFHCALCVTQAHGFSICGHCHSLWGGGSCLCPCYCYGLSWERFPGLAVRQFTLSFYCLLTNHPSSSIILFSLNLLFGSTNLALVAVLNLTKNPDRAVIFYFLAVDLNLGVNFELKWQF